MSIRMMPSIRRSLLALALLTLTLAFAHHALAQSSKPAPLTIKLVTHDGLDAGSVTFTQKKKGVSVHIRAQNLPVGDHAVHIHAAPHCDAPDFKSAGGHFNPTHMEHGFMNPHGHHAGDMPANLTVGPDHTGDASFLVTSITLQPAADNSLFLNGGTSIVIHEHGDDQMTDPSGNSGNRIACGIITR
jgi:Cu-Zn family superoxide dismutase